MKISHFSCVRRSGPVDGNQTTNLGPIIAAFNPDMVIMGGDTPYMDQDQTTSPNIAGGSVLPKLDRGFTKSQFFQQMLQLFDTSKLSAILKCKDIRYIPSDHDLGNQDGASSVTTSSFLGCINQQEVNASTKCFADAFKAVTKTDELQNSQTLFTGLNNIRNPDNNDAGVTGEYPRWVANTVSGESNPWYDSTHLPPAAEDVNLYYPPLYWREGWTFAGVRNDATPDIEYFFIDTATRCDRFQKTIYANSRSSEASAANPTAWAAEVATITNPRPFDNASPTAGGRTALGLIQLQWIKDRIRLSSAKVKIIVCEKMFFQLGNEAALLGVTPGATNRPNNANGINFYSKERDELVQYIHDHADDSGVTCSVLFISGDTHLPHIVNFAPAETFTASPSSPASSITAFTKGFANICSSPVSMGIFAASSGADFTHTGVKWSRRSTAFTNITIDSAKLVVEFIDPWSGYSMCKATMLAGQKYFSTIADTVIKNV